jgi:hypothetical protein
MTGRPNARSAQQMAASWAEYQRRIKAAGKVELVTGQTYAGSTAKLLFRCLIHNQVHLAYPLRVAEGRGLQCCRADSGKTRQAQHAAAYAQLLIDLGLKVRLGLVHLRIPLPLFVFGRAGCRDQGGIDDRALAHRHASLTEMGFDSVKDLFTPAVLLHPVAEGEDRGLIGVPIADEFDAGKSADGGNFDQGLFHGRIDE